MRNPSSSSSPSSSAAGSPGITAATATVKTTAAKNKTACCIKVGLKRGPWTPEEDELLANYIKKEGEGRWRTLPKRAGLLRCGKSCRLRWMNYLRPSVKRGHIAPDEEDLILRLHRLLGNRWSLIAGRIPGRTDNEIKNYWNTHLSKKLISQGIDPRTHKPLNPDDHHNLKPSSSKPNRTSSPNPNNNNPVSASSLEETTSGSGSPILITNINSKDQNGYNNFQITSSMDNNQYQAGSVGQGGYTNLLSNNNNEEDEEINYCTDDVFSSFLNSLINEDAFTTQHHQVILQQVQPTLIAPPSDPLVSITTATSNLGLLAASGWESALITSTSTTTFNQSDHHKRVEDDHVEYHIQ